MDKAYNSAWHIVNNEQKNVTTSTRELIHAYTIFISKQLEYHL